MASAISSATQSIASLLKQTHLDDHEEVLKATNVALKKSKSDIDAQHVKAVALLKLDRYDGAVEVLEGGGDGLKERASLERAYALYKVGRLEESAHIANKESSRGMKHVEAQATYRLEKSARAAELYKQLAGDLSDLEHEENDLRINGGAVDAQLEWTGRGQLVTKKKFAREDLEAFDTAYNAACGSIARSELAQAEILLKRATDLCNASQDLSEDEKISELLPISAQRIYVLSKLGKIASAEEVAAELSVDSIPDLATRQIAQNNSILTSSTTSNPYVAHRVFHSTPNIPKTSSPFSFQSTLLQRNAYILDLLSLKYSGVSTSTSTFLSKHPSPTTSSHINGISVLNAAAVAKDAIDIQAFRTIRPLLEKRPMDVGLALLVTQLYVLANDTTTAVRTLEDLLKRLESSSSPEEQAIAHCPGLVAALVGVYSLRGQKTHIRALLAKSATYWRNRPDAPSSLLRAAALSLLESTALSDLKLAEETFSTLLQEDPQDRTALAGFIAAHASTKPSEIPDSQLEKLTPIARLTSGIDAAAIEDAGIPRAPVTTLPMTRKRPAAEEVHKPVKKRVRKSRLPKDYDDSKTPDPERWLPLRDRSSYRPKGKKSKQKAAALTQGGVVNDHGDSVDVASAAAKVEKASAAGGLGGGGGGGGGGGAKGAQNKKKKKGGKR